MFKWRESCMFDFLFNRRPNRETLEDHIWAVLVTEKTAFEISQAIQKAYGYDPGGRLISILWSLENRKVLVGTWRETPHLQPVFNDPEVANRRKFYRRKPGGKLQRTPAQQPTNQLRLAY